MKNQITIIGGGLAGWATASAFVDNGFSVNLFEGNSQNFGSQQISPNGWAYLSQLLDIKKAKHLLENFNVIKIKSINLKQELNLLCSYDANTEVGQYGSIERNGIINLLKDKVQKTNLVKINKSNVKYIIQDNELNKILDDKGNLITSKFIIGADGVLGITKKFVCGSDNSIKFKQVYRSISYKDEPYKLTKSIMQIILTPDGHFVIYPTIIKSKKATNYVFIPKDEGLMPPAIYNKTLKLLIPEDIEWQSVSTIKNKGEYSNIHNNGVLLVGEASIPTSPHLAQAGNQVLEDAAFIKRTLLEHKDIEKMIFSFIQNRYEQKKYIAQKSSLLGKVLGSHNIIGKFRNTMIKSIGPSILEDILNPIWNIEDAK
jgi:2-polyprenyl-6-methoxyphenol hydroxylase-like FAD-dependent oxidoreductase